MIREYKIRVPKDVPEATSENVQAWLDQALSEGGRLALDPGGGPVRISLSLDREKLVKLANEKRDRVPVVLRRLIASHVAIEPKPAEEPKAERERPDAELPERVLPRKLSYEAEDFLDFIHGADKALAMIYRRTYRLKELKPAETPTEDRKLAGALAEVCNRRSPAWMISNADLVRLAISSFRWSLAQTEDLDARVGESRKEPRPAAIAPTIEIPLAPEPQATPETIRQASEAASIERAHVEAPVQVEGEF
jgi:hypothetical protein